MVLRPPTYNNLAVLLAGRGRHDEAEALHRRAIALAEEGLGPGHPDTAAMLATLAATLDRQGRAGEARTLYTRVQGIVREAGGAALLSASANLGASFARRGQLSEALPHYREAVLVHEALRAGGPQRADGTRSTVLERHADVHGELIRILAALVRQSADAGLGREALAVASLNQSRQFSDLLRRAEVLRFSTLPGFEGLRRERERLFATLAEARLARLTVRDGTGGAEAQKAALAGRVAAAEAALKALEGRLWREYPQYMELASPRPVTADDLQRRLLRPGEALLAFAVLPAQTVIFAVTRDTFRLAVAQVGRADLARRVAQVRRPMERVAQGDSPVVLRQLDPVLLAGLYRDLLEPVADIMTGAGQVIVAADDVLHALPMEMLVTRYGNNERARFEAVRGVGDGAAGKPLLAEYADLPYAGASLRFTYLPSLAALASLRGSARAAPVFRRNLVAFGDPVFSAEDGGATGYGESTRMQLAALAGAAADGKPRLARLAETEREVREVAALTGEPALLLLRREAQERRAKSGILRDARYILFATHGFLAGELQVPPDAGDGVTGGAGQGTRVVAQPSLALTLTGDLEGEDGLLTMREVMEELQLEAELVVLSACNSAGDAVEAGNGEGFSGMTRAFMYAGARRLMVSHWSVESPAARALVTGMFRGVTAGRSAVESLALARSETAAAILASGGRHFSRAHPFFWAPFVVVGD